MSWMDGSEGLDVDGADGADGLSVCADVGDWILFWFALASSTVELVPFLSVPSFGVKLER